MYQYKNKLPFLLILSLLAFCLESNAQRFSAVNPSIQWHQINIEKVKIIYPASSEEEAHRVMNILSSLEESGSQELGDKLFKIKLILLDRGSISNGSVGLAPFKSDFLLSPPRDPYRLGTLNWADLLSIHEYRHVQQRSNARRGITEIGYFLSGEEAWTGMLNLAIPNWFREGDAVQAETELSPQGRGRIPSFMDGYRDFYLNDNIPSYNKARNGSIKDLIPSHYPLGYIMTEYGRQKYGDDFWKEIMQDAASYNGIIYSFSAALKKRTGAGSAAFYKDAVDYFNQSISQNKMERSSFPYTPLTTKESVYTSYHFPQFNQNGQLVAVKNSFEKRSAIFQIEGKKQMKIVDVPAIQDQFFSTKNGIYTWAEPRTHERWAEENYSVIVRYNAKSKERKKLSRRSQYFQPDLSPDGSKILLTEITAFSSQLKIISSKDGNLIQEIENPNGYIFTYPKWDPANENQIISTVRKKSGENALLLFSLDGRVLDTLIDFTFDIIGVATPNESKIIFSAAFNKEIQIYSLDRRTKKIHQLTNHIQSVYQAIVNEDESEIIYTQYSNLGNQILKSKNETLNSFSPTPTIDYPKDILKNLPDQTYVSKPYGRFSHFFNLHSWGLTFESEEPEIKIQTNNYLNTIETDAGIRFSDNYQTLVYDVSSSWAMYYPILSASWNTRKNEQIVQDSILVKFWESNLNATLTVPLNLSDGKYIRGLSLYTGLQRNSINITNFEVEPSHTEALRAGFIFRNRAYQARHNLFSNFAQYLRVDYLKRLDDIVNYQWQIKTAFTFPGLFKNHNLFIEGDWKSEPGQTRLSDSFKYSRGYPRPAEYDQIYRIGINYHLPIIYPDWGLTGLFFFKRVSMNIFYDYSKITTFADVKNLNFNSVGTELVFDVRIFNTFDFRPGFRYAYRLNDVPGSAHRFSFLIASYRL